MPQSLKRAPCGAVPSVVRLTTYCSRIKRSYLHNQSSVVPTDLRKQQVVLTVLWILKDAFCRSNCPVNPSFELTNASNL
eukprot:4713707-Pyramimonas_sp.AAC.1